MCTAATCVCIVLDDEVALAGSPSIDQDVTRASGRPTNQIVMTHSPSFRPSDRPLMAGLHGRTPDFMHNAKCPVTYYLFMRSVYRPIPADITTQCGLSLAQHEALFALLVVNK